MKISSYINLILSAEGKLALSEKESGGLDGFDDAILILDDILDNSQSRDGKPCYYLVHGSEKAKQEAIRLTKLSFEILDQICKSRNIGLWRRLSVRANLKSLYKKINKGQQIDGQLQNNQIKQKAYLNRYMVMVKLFTGSHIKHGFLIGLCLSSVQRRKAQIVANIGEYIGIVRQIDDDIKDYFHNHHEPFGDLLHHKRRLPEILFLNRATESDQKMLQNYLLDPIEYSDNIRTLIFSKESKGEIRGIVNTITKSTDRLLTYVSDDYRILLTDLLKKYKDNIFANLDN